MNKIKLLISPNAEDIRKYNFHTLQFINDKYDSLYNAIKNSTYFNILNEDTKNIIKKFIDDSCLIASKLELMALSVETNESGSISYFIRSRHYDSIINRAKIDYFDVSLNNENVENRDLSISDKLRYHNSLNLKELQEGFKLFKGYLFRESKKYGYSKLFVNEFQEKYKKKNLNNSFELIQAIEILLEWKRSINEFVHNRSLLELDNIVNLISYKYAQDLNDFERPRHSKYESLKLQLTNALKERTKEYRELYIKQMEYDSDLKEIIPNDNNRSLYNLFFNENPTHRILLEIIPDAEKRKRYNNIYIKQSNILKKINNIIPNEKTRLILNYLLGEIIDHENPVNRQNENIKALNLVSTYIHGKDNNIKPLTLNNLGKNEQYNQNREAVNLQVKNALSPQNKESSNLISIISDSYGSSHYQESKQEEFTTNIRIISREEIIKFTNDVNDNIKRSGNKRKAIMIEGMQNYSGNNRNVTPRLG